MRTKIPNPILAVVSLCICLNLAYSAGKDHWNYQQSKEWVPTTATITYVRDYWEDTRLSRFGHRWTSFQDVAYTYEVEGEHHTGQFYRSRTSHYLLGMTIPVKYDPAAPKDSTHVLELGTWEVSGRLTLAAVLLLVSIWNFWGDYGIYKR